MSAENPTEDQLAPTEEKVKSRLEVDDAALRELTTSSSSTSFDERQLMVLLARTQNILKSILDDPEAFSEGSAWNTKMLAAVTGLLNSARGAVKDHNDIGTNNKHVLSVVQNHMKNFATATARHISDELRDVSGTIQVIMDDTKDPMTRAMLAKVQERLRVEVPTQLRGVWREAAKRAISETSEQLSLL